MSAETNPTHCQRCKCFLDVGDRSEHNPHLCDSCGMIRAGASPWHAMMTVLRKKREHAAATK